MAFLRRTLIKLLTVGLLSGAFANDKLITYIEECERGGHRIAAIVGCGKKCDDDFFDGITYMQPHKHVGHYYYIDQNPAVRPDLCKNFLEITSSDIPDQTFQTIYFEYMTPSLQVNPQGYFSTAYRMLQPGGIVAFDAFLWDNPDAWRLFPLTEALDNIGFKDIKELKGQNQFNSRTGNLILAKRPLK